MKKKIIMYSLLGLGLLLTGVSTYFYLNPASDKETEKKVTVKAKVKKQYGFVLKVSKIYKDLETATKSLTDSTTESIGQIEDGMPVEFLDETDDKFVKIGYYATSFEDYYFDVYEEDTEVTEWEEPVMQIGYVLKDSVLNYDLVEDSAITYEELNEIYVSMYDGIGIYTDLWDAVVYPYDTNIKPAVTLSKGDKLTYVRAANEWYAFVKFTKDGNEYEGYIAEEQISMEELANRTADDWAKMYQIQVDEDWIYKELTKEMTEGVAPLESNRAQDVQKNMMVEVTDLNASKALNANPIKNYVKVKYSKSSGGDAEGYILLTSLKQVPYER